MFELVDLEKPVAIKVIGIGGGGCNAVKSMATSELENVSFYLANSDFAASSKEPCLLNKIQLGKKLTQGLGAGADPSVGREAAKETLSFVMGQIRDADILFVAAGMGGGTGTGAAPIISKAARELGILTVGIVTMPFYFEGKSRQAQAERGLLDLQKNVDSLITISNNRLASLSSNLPIKKAFEPANTILRYAVHGIINIIQTTGIINVDFADVKTILTHPGRVIMGTGIAEGSNRAEVALEQAISSPLLEDYKLDGAKGILVNISGSSDLTMDEYHFIIDQIQNKADKDAEIITGIVMDETLNDALKVTVIASGLETVKKSSSADLPFSGRRKI